MGVLSDHRRRGKTLTPPLADVHLVDWQGKHLPENLWFAYLIDRFEIVEASQRLDAVYEMIDAGAANEEFLGYVSDFRTLEKSVRDELLSNLDGGLSSAVGADFRAALALYPEGPAVWLAAGGDRTLEASFALIRRLVGGLRDSHSKLASECRMLVMRRLLAQGRIHFSPDVPDEELTRLLLRYPNVNDDGARHVQQFARVTMLAMEHLISGPFGNWSEYFWVSNYKLARCQ